MVSHQESELILYSSTISNASARLRIALNLKQLPHKIITLNLSRGEHQNASFTALNPSQAVPLLVHCRSNEPSDNVVISQSIAAMEYLDEAFPSSYPLMPKDVALRARVRTLVGILATDTHPLLTHRVSRAVPTLLPGAKIEAGNVAWDKHWLLQGLAKFDKELQRQTAGLYCVGDDITLADVVLMPEVWMAKRLGIGVDGMANVARVCDRLNQIEIVRKEQQQDE